MLEDLKERGGLPVVGVVLLIVFLFAIFVIFTYLDEPLRTVVGTAENTASNAPGGIFDNVRTAWVVFPVIGGVLAFVWFFAYIYSKEREVGYR